MLPVRLINISCNTLQLKEFQSRQKPDLPQNGSIETSTVETPQDNVNNYSFTSSLQDQQPVPYQNYDRTFGTNANQADLSAFFNNSVVPGAQQNMFQMFGDQLAQQHTNTVHQYHPSEVNEPPTTLLETSYVPVTQSIDNNFSEFPSNVATAPDLNISQQLSDELHATNLKLNAEQLKNMELVGQLSKQSAKIEELQMELQKVKLENSAKTNVDAESLKEQLDAHAQTISILVGEKAELTAALTKYQGLARSNASEVEELQGRLNASRHRVSVLERDIGNMKSSHERYDSTQQKLCDELEQCQEEIKKFKKNILEAEEEIAELKRSSSLKSEKIGTLEQELKKINSELELSKLRVEQLSIGDVIESAGRLENLGTEKIFFEQKARELEGVVQQLNAERDQSNQQYQNYVQQLNQEISKLAQQLQEYVAENERLSKREQGLVKHVGELERQIQQQISKQKKNSEVSVTSEEMDSLKAQCDALQGEKAQWEVSNDSQQFFV